MTPPLVLRTAARWATQRTRGWGHGVRAIHRSRQRLSAIGADDGAATRPSAADAGLSLHRYVIGRSVTQVAFYPSLSSSSRSAFASWRSAVSKPWVHQPSI